MAKTLLEYAIRAGTNEAYGQHGPLSWIFQGSANGADWIALDTVSAYTFADCPVVEYKIRAGTAAGYGEYAPKTWTLQGSDNGADWDTLDTVASETGWADNEIRTYTCDTATTVYRYYRFNITATNRVDGFVIIGQIELHRRVGGGNVCAVMTTNNTPAPYVTAADVETWPAFQAFDVYSGEDNDAWFAASACPHWISFDFNTTGNYALGWEPSEIGAFAIDTPAEYRHHRLYVSGTLSGNVLISELELREAIGGANVGPTMSDYNVPSPNVVTCSDDNAGWGLAWAAFNHTYGDPQDAWGTPEALPQWVALDDGVDPLSPDPHIDSITPRGYVGDRVTITGTEFGATQGSSTVEFNGVVATEYISWSNTTIVVRVPAGASSGSVVVVKP